MCYRYRYRYPAGINQPQGIRMYPCMTDRQCATCRNSDLIFYDPLIGSFTIDMPRVLHKRLDPDGPNGAIRPVDVCCPNCAIIKQDSLIQVRQTGEPHTGTLVWNVRSKISI